MGLDAKFRGRGSLGTSGDTSGVYITWADDRDIEQSWGHCHSVRRPCANCLLAGWQYRSSLHLLSLTRNKFACVWRRIVESLLFTWWGDNAIVLCCRIGLDRLLIFLSVLLHSILATSPSPLRHSVWLQVIIFLTQRALIDFSHHFTTNSVMLNLTWW